MLRPRKSSASFALAAALVLAGAGLSSGCGDDTTGSGGSGGASSSAAQGSGSTTTSAKSVGSTSGGGDGGESGSSTGETATGTGGDGTGGTGSGGSEPSACDDLPPGPIEPTVFYDGFDGSEDIAFDGLGHLAGKRGGEMILVDADLVEDVVGDVPSAFGTRFTYDGTLIVALPNDGEVIAVDEEGEIATLADGLEGPNGIHIAGDGTIWVTEFNGGRIRTIPAEGGEAALFLADQPTANGIYVDEAREIVFYTNWSAGQMWRVDLAGTQEPSLVGEVAGASLDGLTMDVCGNVYAVDQGGGRVFRMRTDEAGDLLGEPELIATLATGAANAQFGRGEGFDSTTLYAAGTAGDVYAIDVGVEGAPQAGP